MWAKENGLWVTIDVHGLPLSQNGCALRHVCYADGTVDNSGRKLAAPGWFDSTVAFNRSLSVVRQLSNEFRKSAYGNIVVSIEPVNEPKTGSSSEYMDTYRRFLSQSYPIVHAPSRPFALSFHTAFRSFNDWVNFMPRASQFRDAILTHHPVRRLG